MFGGVSGRSWRVLALFWGCLGGALGVSAECIKGVFSRGEYT